MWDIIFMVWKVLSKLKITHLVTQLVVVTLCFCISSYTIMCARASHRFFSCHIYKTIFGISVILDSSDCPKKIDYLINLWSILAVTLTFNFQYQNGICYISCKIRLIASKLKSKHIHWILFLKCDRQVWPWPWPWPWIFKAKYWICCIFWQKPSNCRIKFGNFELNSFDHLHGLDYGFSRSKFEIAVSLEWEGQLKFRKRDISHSFMTMSRT